MMCRNLKQIGGVLLIGYSPTLWALDSIVIDCDAYHYHGKQYQHVNEIPLENRKGRSESFILHVHSHSTMSMLIDAHDAVLNAGYLAENIHFDAPLSDKAGNMLNGIGHCGGEKYMF